MSHRLFQQSHIFWNANPGNTIRVFFREKKDPRFIFRRNGSQTNPPRRRCVPFAAPANAECQGDSCLFLAAFLKPRPTQEKRV